MLEKKFNQIADLIDKKFKNGTVMVVIVANLIVATWLLSNTVNANLTANIMQSQKNTEISQYIVIGWKKYRIILEEVK